ncbi:hypothetical protein JHK82_052593 [Glycine max]|nr:hypothetical protein JHK86_052439 [Glycine max]KAG5082441.1 hypothetical protein JHK84_052479 [Glycine max]KAG5085196.1 hypothetical protein JHK82_052593 [Glycine max]
MPRLSFSRSKPLKFSRIIKAAATDDDTIEAPAKEEAASVGDSGQLCAIKEVMVVCDDQSSKECLKQLNQ